MDKPCQKYKHKELKRMKEKEGKRERVKNESKYSRTFAVICSTT
jgi:hypothetical protein